MATSFNSTLPEIYESYPAIAPSNFKGKLNGKVALITGTSGGIGHAIAKAFAAAGASVAAVARREPELNALVDEIKAAGGKAIPVVADVSKAGAPQQIVSTVERTLGPIDILVNNAGIARNSPLSVEPTDLDFWWSVYEVNVKAPVSLIHAVMPSMLKRKTGYLITTSSSVATLPLPCMTAYSSSKAAISKFHETLSKELEDTGVTTFAVHPGMVNTGLGAAEGAINKEHIQHPAMQKFLAAVTGDHKSQTPEVCADTMVALASDPAYKILTGHHINATQELPPVLAEAQKKDKGRLGAERLYLVNIATL